MHPLKLLAVLPLLAACEAPPTLSPEFGAAYRHNMAVQIADPAPAAAFAPLDSHDGRRAGDAAERYHAGKVRPPAALGTTDHPAAVEAPR